jgi:hypothetical protein
MPRIQLPTDISDLRNLKGTIGKMHKYFKKYTLSSRKNVDILEQARIAEHKFSVTIANRIGSLHKAVERSKDDKSNKAKANKVVKYISDINEMLEKKYTMMEDKIEKLRLKLENSLARKAAKAAEASKAAKKKAAKGPVKKSSKKPATKPRSKVPAAYRLFGGFNDMEYLDAELSDLNL